VYAAKTYARGQEEAFENEKGAYEKIGESGRVDDSLLCYYGSYTYCHQHTVLLEYANGGTWEQFMKTPQPERPKDILRTWTALLGLGKAVDRIHVCEG
jgi:hypothetical protein